ncbi:AMP-binding protein [Paraburkholderia kururiensis]|uniref:AMP-binding protein n=1 Tax=Paraburkholderia kururiensis TaxID=984307 RepID=UPI000349EBE0|nr:AMP-binding protein [Paraburkholderia kururiensis]
MNLGQLIERNARLFGAQPAIVFEGRATTHREFRDRVVRLINALVALGAKHQDRIAILSQNRTEYLECYGAAELGGFVAVGVNYRLSAAEQLAVLGDCQPAVLVFEAQYRERVEAFRGMLPDVRFVCLDDAPAWAQAYGDLLAGADAHAPATRATDDDIVYLMYTSGSTGKPKGVMLSNGGQYLQAAKLALAHASQTDDRMEVVMPLYHIGGLTEQHAYALVGAATYLHRAFDPLAVLMSIREHQSTAAHLAPIMIHRMLDAMETTSHDVASLRTVVYASAPMSVSLLRRAIDRFGAVFTQVYGMTEVTISSLLACQHDPYGGGLAAQRLASGGQPCHGVEVRIVDGDGKDAAPGEIGEICIRSDAMFKGYWNAPEATRCAFSGDWFHTGDVGYLDDDAFVFIVDRKKDMIVSGGENIYSREVEEAIMRHPQVAEAAVVGVPDDVWGECVKAFVVCRANQTLTEADILAHCRTLIASYKKPRSVEFVAALPRKPSTDKVDKMALREAYWRGQARLVS